MDKDELLELLKENLEVSISLDRDHNYMRARVKIMFNGEVISTDNDYVDVED